MINIKIKPEERINIECYLLMKDLLTKYYRVGEKQPFEINIDEIDSQEVYDFKVFTKSRDKHSLIENFQDRGLIEAEPFSKGMWVSLDEEKSPYYRISLLPNFFDQFKKYEKEILRMVDKDDVKKNIYKYKDLLLNIEKALISYKGITKDIMTERRETKFLVKILQKDGLVATYLELAEFMDIQSFNPLVNNMDMAKDVQDVRKSLEDYLASVFSDKKVAKIICSDIQNIRSNGYKMKTI